MSIQALNKAFKVKVTSTQKLVLIVLSNYANEDNMCYPSHQTIADMTCLTRRTVISTIKSLKDIGYIEEIDYENVPKKYRNNQNCYVVNFTSESLSHVKMKHEVCENDDTLECESLSHKYKEDKQKKTKELIYAYKSIKKDINSRKEDWILLAEKEIQPTNDQSEIFETFINYWTAHNLTDKKFKAEKEKSFYFKQRFSTFVKNGSRNTRNNISQYNTTTVEELIADGIL